MVFGCGSSSPSNLASPGCSPISEVQEPRLGSQWSLPLMNPVIFLSLRCDLLTQQASGSCWSPPSLARALSVYVIPIKASVCSFLLQKNHCSHRCPSLQQGPVSCLCPHCLLTPVRKWSLVRTSF